MAAILPPSFDQHPLLADAELDCLLDDDWAAAELQSADLQPLAAAPPAPQEAAPEPAPVAKAGSGAASWGAGGAAARGCRSADCSSAVAQSSSRRQSSSASASSGWLSKLGSTVAILLFGTIFELRLPNTQFQPDFCNGRRPVDVSATFAPVTCLCNAILEQSEAGNDALEMRVYVS